MTSSRVMSPISPVGVTSLRFTSRSLASFLIGGFAMTGSPVMTGEECPIGREPSAPCAGAELVGAADGGVGAIGAAGAAEAGRAGDDVAALGALPAAAERGRRRLVTCPFVPYPTRTAPPADSSG